MRLLQQKRRCNSKFPAQDNPWAVLLEAGRMLVDVLNTAPSDATRQTMRRHPGWRSIRIQANAV